MSLQTNEVVSSSQLQPDLHPAQAKVLNCNFCTKLWVTSVRSLSTWVNDLVSFGLLMLHLIALTAVRLGSLGNLVDWKHYLETLVLHDLSFRKGFPRGRVLLFALVLSAEYTWNRTTAASATAFSLPAIRLNVILLSSTLSWAGGHVTSRRLPGDIGSCPSSTCKNLIQCAHPLF